MSRSNRFALLAVWLCVAASAAPAQQPDEPLGELLDVIPMPEEAPAKADPPGALRPVAAPPVEPGNVVPVELPASAATGAMPPEEPEAEPLPLDAEAAAAEAAWAARQEQRRAEINAVEAPVVDRLNAEMAARAAAASRRFADEQAAYEQRLAELEADARRREAEHAAAMEAHARRVAREQAAYRACLAGDRDACNR
jgi:hypothetical protein